MCKHYRPSGECSQLPTVRLFHGSKPAEGLANTRDYSDVHEYCPHGGPQPEWQWTQQECSMYEPSVSKPA